MPKSRMSSAPSKSIFALLSLSWALKDGLVISNTLREKLAVPPCELTEALASLTLAEHHTLKSEILQVAACHSLPSPLKANELCACLDKFTAAA